MNKALRVIKETPTDFGYVIREEYWEGLKAEVGIISASDENMEEALQFEHDLQKSIDEAPDEMLMTTCYTDEGYWIGELSWAKQICETYGIAPSPSFGVGKGDLRPCSHGWSDKEQKWYGWSHRAIFGFGIGSVVEEGDCAASSGWIESYLSEHPEKDDRLSIGFTAKTLFEAKCSALAFASSVG